MVNKTDRPEIRRIESPPTIEEQWRAKHQATEAEPMPACSRCFHGYAVQPNGANTPVFYQCYEGPPIMQTVMTQAPGARQPVPAQQQQWTTMGPDQWCHKFVDHKPLWAQRKSASN